MIDTKLKKDKDYEYNENETEIYTCLHCNEYKAKFMFTLEKHINDKH